MTQELFDDPADESKRWTSICDKIEFGTTYISEICGSSESTESRDLDYTTPDQTAPELLVDKLLNIKTKKRDTSPTAPIHYS